MKIEMPRGDYRPVKFKIKNRDGTDFLLDVDEIFFTCKEGTYTKGFLFQKRLSRNEIKRTEDGYYHFEILPENTDNLTYQDYYFDIEIYNKAPLIKQTKTGTLTLTKEITHVENEV